MKPGEKGLARLVSATRYSWQGIQSAWRHEAAFRQEAMLAVIGVPVALWLAMSVTQFLLLTAPLLFLLVIELANSAIESVVDRIGHENHELSGRAKDMGSAMVFISLLIVGLCWCTVLWEILVVGG
jgi:diacylglycerol kinase (ATP)